MNLERFFDHIFVINLSRRQDRWYDTLDELKRNDVPLSCIDRFDAHDNRKSGEAGCTRSHRELMRQIAGGHWDRVLIFEDDIEVITLEKLKKAGFVSSQAVWKTFCTVLDGVGTLQERFSHLSSFLPPKWDMFYLGGGYGEPPLSRYNRHVLRCGFIQTTSSYGVTREFAKAWTERVDKECPDPDYVGPVDNVYGGLSKEFLYYIFQPRLIYQRQSPSDITGEDHSYLFSMTDPVHENLF